MVGGLIADDVHQRNAGTLCVVEISETVGQTRSAMKQSRGWPPSQARIAVRRPSRHPLKKGEHTPYARDPVKRSDEMHLAGPWISETVIDSTIDQRVYQAFGAANGAFARQHRTSRALRPACRGGFGHAATASITAMGGRIGALLEKRSPAFLSNVENSA